MKKVLATATLAFLFFSAIAQDRDAVLGKWQSEHGSGQIEVYRVGEKYFGKLVWLKEPNDANGNPKKDIYNPSPNLRSQTIVGLEILKNFEYKGNGLWDNGSVYNPKSGKSYRCKMTLVNNNKLNIRGYMGFSMLGKTESWTRIKQSGTLQ